MSRKPISPRPSKSVEAYMPLFIGPYLADTMHLSRDQHGGYLLLLMAYWREGGPLPDDDAFLASVTKCSAAEWRKMRPVLARFFQIVDGRWTQKRADVEIARAIELKTKRTEAGETGAKKRWQTHSKRIANASQKVWQNDAISPLTVSSNEDTSVRDDLVAAVDAYNQAAKQAGWATCQQITGKRKAGVLARMREAGGVEPWKAAMTRAAASAFLRGETGRSAGHENWRPTLDFFIRPETFAKLVEGGYDGRQGHRQAPAGMASIHANEAEKRAQSWIRRGLWSDSWGPKEGETGCCITAEQWADFRRKEAA